MFLHNFLMLDNFHEISHQILNYEPFAIILNIYLKQRYTMYDLHHGYSDYYNFLFYHFDNIQFILLHEVFQVWKMV